MGNEGIQDQKTSDDSNYPKQSSDNMPMQTRNSIMESANAEIGTPQNIRVAEQAGPEDIDVQDASLGEGNFKSPLTVIPRVPNDQVAALIRRFDNQMFHVKAISIRPPANLDMNISEAEEFSPEKLRAHLERLYTSVIVQLVAFWKQLAHLRSWSDWRRTSTFLSLYIAAWTTDMLLATMLVFVIILLLFPPTRQMCFPPSSPKFVNAITTDGGKKESTTLAPDGIVAESAEKQPGDGTEIEARSFMNSIATLLLSTSGGKNGQGVSETSAGGEEPDISIPDLTELQKDMIHAKDSQDAMHQETSESVSKIVWNGAEKAMHVIAHVVDNWERMGNASNPTPPFSGVRPKILFTFCLVLSLLGSLFITSYLMVKGLGLVLGIALFGAPALSYIDVVVSRKHPRIRNHMKLRNSVLHGVPTNAQLSIALLRIGERRKAPITLPTDSTLERTLDGHKPQNAAGPDQDADTKQTETRGGFLNFLRTVTGGGINVFLATDRVKAAVGDRHAKDRIGVVRPPGTDHPTGPVHFQARYKGRRGYACLTTTATSPALSWAANLENLNPAWTIPIADIEELQKVGGLGWKSKIMVHWALEKEVMDGLLIKSTGEEHHITAIPKRDELFNRLISAGPQMWEAL